MLLVHIYADALTGGEKEISYINFVLIVFLGYGICYFG